MAIDPVSSFSFIQLFLVLLFTGPAEQGEMQTRIHEELYSQNEPVFFQLNIGQLRNMGQNEKLAPILYGKEKPKAIMSKAIDTFSQISGIDKSALLSVSNDLRSIGFWLIDMSRYESQQRFIIALDFSKPNKIGDSIANLNPNIKHSSHKQGEWLLRKYSFDSRGRFRVWAAEKNGLVFISLDPMVIQRAIRKHSTPQKLCKVAPTAPILKTNINGKAFFNSLVGFMGKYDYYDFVLAADLFDFSAYKSLAIEIHPTALNAKLTLESNSLASELLKPNLEGLRLMSALPKKDCVAFSFGLKNPKAVWQHFTHFAKMLPNGNRGDIVTEMKKEFKSSFNLDLEKDLIENISGLGITIPSPKQISDLERKLIIQIEAKDAKKAKSSVSTFISNSDMQINNEGKANTLTASDARGRQKIALQNDLIAFSLGRNLKLKEMLPSVENNSKKAKNINGTLAKATFDISNMLPFRTKALNLDLKRSGQTLELNSNLELINYTISLTQMFFTKRAFSNHNNQIHKPQPPKVTIVKQLSDDEINEIKKLIKALGSNHFKERMNAKNMLQAMGERAHPVLNEFKKHTDPEIRMAIKELLKD